MESGETARIVEARSAHRTKAGHGPGAGPQPEPTIDLVAAAQSGDTSAKQHLVVRALPRFRTWAHGKLPASARGYQDTQDLAQDAALQLLTRLHAFTPRHEQAVPAYLRLTAKNRVRDEVRRIGRRPCPVDLDDDLPSEGPSPLCELERNGERRRVRRALRALREKDRRLIAAGTCRDCSLTDLARMMGLGSAAAAGMALRRAEAHLKARLAN